MSIFYVYTHMSNVWFSTVTCEFAPVSHQILEVYQGCYMWVKVLWSKYLTLVHIKFIFDLKDFVKGKPPHLFRLLTLTKLLDLRDNWPTPISSHVNVSLTLSRICTYCLSFKCAYFLYSCATNNRLQNSKFEVYRHTRFSMPWSQLS